MVTWLYRCPNEGCDTYERVDFEAFYQSVGRATMEKKIIPGYKNVSHKTTY